MSSTKIDGFDKLTEQMAERAIQHLISIQKACCAIAKLTEQIIIRKEQTMNKVTITEFDGTQHKHITTLDSEQVFEMFRSDGLIALENQSNDGGICINTGAVLSVSVEHAGGCIWCGEDVKPIWVKTERAVLPDSSVPVQFMIKRCPKCEKVWKQ